MKRPLFKVCLAAACLTAGFYALRPPSVPVYSHMDGGAYVACGRVYQKEYRTSYRGRQLLLYLSDVTFPDGEFGASALSQSPRFNGAAQISRLSQTSPFFPRSRFSRANSTPDTATSEISRLPQSLRRPDTLLCHMEETDPEPALGSFVCLSGTARSFERARNPGGFDAALYYAALNAKLSMTGCRIIGQRGGSPLRERLWKFRRDCARKLETYLNERDASVLKNILLGDRETLDKEVKELYQKNGIAHILAISGLHISILGMGFYRCARRLGVPNAAAAAAAGTLIIFYGLTTGAGVSAYRAAGMFLIRMLAQLSGRTYDMRTALGVLLALMLARQPLYLFHSGFLLSFASVMGVCLLYPALEGKSALGAGYGAYDGAGGVVCAAGRAAGRSLRAGLSIAAATLPVHLWYYYEIPVYGVILNLAVLPLMTALVGLGLALAVLPGGLPAKAAALGVHGILELYGRLCALCETWPGHTWTPGRPAFWQVLLYAALLTGVIFFAKRLKRRTKMLIIVCGVTVLSLRFQGGFAVDFLDVGQGDCVCIRAGSATYLVDGGSTDRPGTGKYDIAPFLKYHGRADVDAVFVTHADADHCNGVLELLRGDIGVGRLVLPDLGENGKDGRYREIEATAAACGVPVSYMSRGDVWRENGASFRCLHPPRGFAGANANEGSLVLYAAYGPFSVLLTGDVEGEGERMLAAEMRRYGIDSLTVLKVAHHGSCYSTGREFLEGLSVPVGILSCGKGNVYGHPHEELVERLLRHGTTLYRTERSGAVTVKAGGRKVLIAPFREDGGPDKPR